MVPARRDRPSDGFGDNTDNEAGAGRRTVSNKRPRLSVPGEDVDTTVLSDALGGHEPSPTPFPQTQRFGLKEYEQFRDNVDAMSEQAEELDQREQALLAPMMEALRNNANILTENRIANNGILESVTCINFMCHKNLVFKLGPLINFIIGHNGSGKSAVLTALQLCLGGKATNTNRGSNLKSFVKEGEDASTLIVKIKNKAPGSYKYDLYGDSIVVERHFNVHGQSGFKLKSASGKIISTKKADLDDINDFYALSLDNPMNVLTQDAARQFLSSSSSSDKYKFFVKGVQLETLDADYAVLASRIDQMHPRIVTAEGDCEAQKIRYRQAETRMKMQARQQELRQKRQQIMGRMAWAQVYEQEKLLQEHDELLSAAEQKINSENDNLRQSDQACEHTKTIVETRRSAFEQHMRDLEPLNQEKDAIQQRIDQKGEEFNASRSEERQMQEQIAPAKREVRKLENSVDEEYRRLQAADGGSNSDKSAQIRDANEQCKALLAQRQNEMDKTTNLAKEAADAEKVVADATERLNQASNDVSSAQSRLQGLDQNRTNADAGFHPNLKNVRAAIARENRWRDKPVGPIGAHIKLRKTEWSHAVERIFGTNLGGFVCTNRHDQVILSDIFRRCDYRSPVLTSTRDHLSLNEPDERFDTPLRILEFDDELVKNVSIINHSIDKLILVGDRATLFKIMYDNGAKPINTLAGICHHDGDSRISIRYAYGFRDSGKSDSMPSWDTAPRIRTSIEDQIQLARESLDRARDQKASAERTRRDAQEAFSEKRRAEERSKRTIERLKREADGLEDEALRLERELEEAAPQAGLLDTFKTQLEEARESLKSYEAQTENQIKISQAKKAEMEAIETELHEVQQRLARFEEKQQKLEDKISAAVRRMTEKQTEQHKSQRNVTLAEHARDERRNDREQTAEDVSQFIQAAMNVFPERIGLRANETPESLQKQLDAINATLHRAEREAGGTPEEVMAAFVLEKAAYDAAWKAIKVIKLDMEQIQMTLNERQIRWKKFRRAISARARNHFIYLLQERAFRGRINLNHQNKTLDLTVQPDSSEASHRRSGDPNERQTKTLSGGEKSFSTICLLLSLWDAMGSPIRCLDEFDVFMDSVNRDISMKMMIAAARRSVSRQYILISPQAMGNMDLNSQDDVKVLKMPDPVRNGQRTLADVGVTVG